ncbi:RNA-dependent RNA polymerase [viral metagenome]|uniref:RNA-dependent RNA polymerase n=1 Tax=viral metagenome TaxID=1070528 RepID=A0A6L2ZJD4_9ZZZZ
MYTAWVTGVEGTWLPQVHANCSHNVLVSLLTRQLGSTPSPSETGFGELRSTFRELERLAGRYPGRRWTLSETALSYTGALRRRYLDAERSLLEDGPLTARDHFLCGFLKAEKINALPKFQKPRMIFPRTPRYNLVLASWLKPFEHWLWGNLKSVGRKGVPKSRVVAKGLNPVERANLIVRKCGHFRDPVVFEVDGKAFEAHCVRKVLSLEHRVYGAAHRFPGELASLLAKQLELCGAVGSVRFKRDGGRASGDFNTGMGNSLIMVAVVGTVMRRIGVRFDSLVDGDNALLFVEAGDLPRVVADFARHAVDVSGQEMVLERPVEISRLGVEAVRFGQSAPVWDGSKWRMVRDFRKVLSQGTSSHDHLRDRAFAPAFLAGVARCESSLGRGLPILGAWSHSLWTWASSFGRVATHCYRDYQASLALDVDRMVDPYEVEVSDDCRWSFFRAFGVTPEEQLVIERELSSPRLGPWKPMPGMTSWNKEFHDAWSF